MSRMSQVILVLGLSGTISALVAADYLVSSLQREKATPRPALQSSNRSLTVHDSLLTGSLFRLPVASQESLFVTLRGEDSSQLRYGIGSMAARIEKWLSSDLFADAHHARWIAPKSYAYKGDPEPQPVDLPVRWTDRSFQIPGAPTRWKSGVVMRIWTQADPSGSEWTQQVEYATFESSSEVSAREVIYTRGAGSNHSVLRIRSSEVESRTGVTLSPKTNRWIIALFSSRTAERKDSLLVIGVLSGKFVSKDGSISLNAGQAACLRVSQNNVRAEYVQPVELIARDHECILRWEAVEHGYEPERVQIHDHEQLPDSTVGYSFESLKAMFPLSAYDLWANQKVIYYPVF